MNYFSNRFIRKILMILSIIYLLLKISNMVDLSSLLFIDVYAASDADFYSHNRFDAPFTYSSNYTGTFNEPTLIISNPDKTDVPTIYYRMDNFNSSTLRLRVYHKFYENRSYNVKFYMCYTKSQKNLSYSVRNSSNVALSKFSMYDTKLDTTLYVTNGIWYTYPYCYSYDFNLDFYEYQEDNYLTFGLGMDNTFTAFMVYSLEIEETGQSNSWFSALFDVINNSGVEGKLDDINKNQQETNNKLDEMNDTLTDSDTSQSSETAGGFFNDFEDKDYGLSDVITMPLSFINDITSAKCSPLVLPLPFVKSNATLPCMTEVYTTHFGEFLSIYQTITTGLIAYWVCVNIFGLVKGFKDPDSDKVEVMDL